ncbi:SGNH/GDSL hydrolase family protein [Teredinibacter waterburyi]|jgi:Lysophospholipase L1 and related esterases|uniref:SGNH/GDSL hydrolase family protein n=1 Tax=Teredinibacter waterburyi TaxID=1500538 RepID=UPI00165EE4F3|nr:SGNH/GDSL hydrolase family protein [Teredinibacter waterburyi]
MQTILVYSDSLTWGIVPGSRARLSFDERWPGAMEHILRAAGMDVRVVEDCLNGRRTLWEDPFKPGRRAMTDIAQRIEINSPLSLLVLMLGTNDLQNMHNNNAWHAAQGVASLVTAVRQAPIEESMPVPEILIVAPPAITGAKGPMANKFAGAERFGGELAGHLKAVASQFKTHFYDSNTVVSASAVDGVHLDAPGHFVLAQALADKVSGLIK